MPREQGVPELGEKKTGFKLVATCVESTFLLASLCWYMYMYIVVKVDYFFQMDLG